MNSPQSSTFRRGLKLVTTPAVLALLSAVGWWGHSNHWQLSHSAGAAVSRDGKASPGSPSKGAAGDGQVFTQDDMATGELSPVQFASEAGAKSCGIEVVAAERRPMDDRVKATGVIGYDQTRLAQLAVRAPGSVAKVVRHLGDSVKKGDALVVVDAMEVGAAKANLLEACLLYDLKAKNLERLEQIKNSIAMRELVEAEAACKLAQTQRSNALQRLINLGFTLKLEDIESIPSDQRANHLHLLGMPEGFEPEADSGNLIPLTAPFDGVITSCEVVRGETVEPTKALYVLADVRRVWLHLNIRQDDAARVSIGSKVMFKGEASQPVEGTLTWIGTEIDARTRTVQARAEIENPPFDGSDSSPTSRRQLRAGEFGTAGVLICSQPDALSVPDKALHWQWELGREIVFVAADDGRTFHPQFVTRGITENGHAQILDGLESGDRVVTGGSRILSAELSERLQERVGTKADAERNFHHDSGVVLERDAEAASRL